MKPFISIVIPTYQMGHYVGEAIKSCLDQSYSNYEVIVGDNASTDGTDRVVGAFSSGKIHYVRNPVNVGMYTNINRLIGVARGRYIKICCADDLLAGNCLERVAASLEEHSFPAALSHAISVMECRGGRNLVRKVHAKALDRKTDRVDASLIGEYVARGSMCGWALTNVVMDRELFMQFGCYESAGDGRDYAKDAVSWVKFLMRHGCVLLKEHLYYERVHAGQARFTRSRLICLEEMLELTNFMLAATIPLAQKKHVVKYRNRVIARHYVSGWLAPSRIRREYYNEMARILSRFDNCSVKCLEVFLRLIETSCERIRILVRAR